MEPTLEIPDGEEYKMRSQTKEERENFGDEVPTYRIDLDLSDDDEERLKDQFCVEFKALKDEREELDLESKWESRQRQYDGLLKSNKRLMFNLHVHESKIKTDSIVTALNQAFLDADPKIGISPRPQEGREDGFEVAEAQAQFLDFAMDEEVKPEKAFIKIARSAVMKFVGIGKLLWEYDVRPRRREETYQGNKVPIGVAPDGVIVYKNEGLEKFLENYPDGLEKHKGYVKMLQDEKEINLVVQYKDEIKNNPVLKYVQLENFYVRNGCDYSDGLRNEHCIVERQDWTYWDLMEKERKGEFKNVDQLWKQADGKENKDYTTAVYSILEATMYFKTSEDDEEETKTKAWFGEGEKISNDKGQSDANSIEGKGQEVYLGGEIFPYYGFDTDYMAFYVTTNDDGFYGGAKSVMYMLRDNNTAQDALLNLALHGTLVRNTLTPIVREGSEIEEMFLDHQFEVGKPLPVDDLTDDVSKAMGFVEWPNVDMNATFALMDKLKRDGSDVTSVNDSMQGNASDMDPDAPAKKTIALLEQAGIGIRDYIRTFVPSFNIFATNLLQLYHQMSKEDRKYKVVGKASAVTGENPFESITRQQMVVKTNIQSRAASFVFDKINEKKEALAAYQMAINDPYASRQPKLMYKALRTLLETMGPRWKAIVDTTFDTPEEFEKKLQQVAMQAIQALGQQAQENAQVTGVAPEPKALMQAAPGVVGQAQAEMYMGPPEEKK